MKTISKAGLAEITKRALKNQDILQKLNNSVPSQEQIRQVLTSVTGHPNWRFGWNPASHQERLRGQPKDRQERLH